MGRQLFSLVAGFLGTCLASSAAMAWTSPGHMVVALIAYDQMDPAARTKAVELLRSPAIQGTL